MNTDINTKDWEAIQKSAKRAFGRFGKRTGLELDWFINTAYLALLKARKSSTNLHPRYLWLVMEREIYTALNKETDRRKQRDGSFRKVIPFTDMGKRYAGNMDDEGLEFEDTLEARPSKQSAEADTDELWGWARDRLGSFPYRVLKLWAAGFSAKQISEETGAGVPKVRYHRAAAVRVLKGAVK